MLDPIEAVSATMERNGSVTVCDKDTEWQSGAVVRRMWIFEGVGTGRVVASGLDRVKATPAYTWYRASMSWTPPFQARVIYLAAAQRTALSHSVQPFGRRTCVRA